MNSDINPLEPGISCFLDLSEDFIALLLKAFKEKHHNIGEDLKRDFFILNIVHMN